MANGMIAKMEATSKTHLHNIMQIAVFRLNDRNFYGINISKIRSIEDFKKYEVIHNNTIKNELLEGHIRHQNAIVPVVALEKWLGIYTPENIYYEYLVCEYNKERIALAISGIRNIFNVPIESLQKPNRMADMLTYEAIVDVDGEKTIVLVLDVEKLLYDAFGANYQITHNDKVVSQKRLLIAEDSRTAQAIVREILETSELDYQIFNDGEELIDYLSSLDEAAIENVGMVITDLEMPRKDGYQVLKFIHETPRLATIPVAVNTSMSDSGVNEKTHAMGAAGFIAKTDPATFLGCIAEYMRK
ncbi:chemotaxis protein CheV [Campylobacterota bacterium]|nr:chemotaxis protein CheV [Campylobacterota bacterium]